MTKMKDSGIEWIGEIPESWNTNRIKHHFKVVSGATPKSEDSLFWDGDIPWITPADYKTQDKFVSKGRRNITQEGYESCGTSLVPSGSIVFSKRAPVGSVSLTKNDLCTNQGCLSCIPNSDTNAVYFYYVMSIFTEQFELVSAGTTFKEISADVFSNFILPNPPINEQNRIASYLDIKCAKIDAVLEQTRNSIEEYKKLKQSVMTQAVTKGIRPGRKMKDSGIDFIGMIPEAWDFSRMKNVASIVDCKNRTPDNIPEGEYTVVRTACIRNGKFTYEGSYKTDESNYRAWTERGAPHKGDVFFTREAPVGEACMVPDDPSLCMGQRVMYFRPFDGIDGRFLMYSVYGSLAQEYIITKNNGSTVGHLKLGQVGELPLLLCSYEEQQQICDYLDVRTKRIELIIAKKEQFLTALESYKKSLIYECVTGKSCV